MRALKWWLIAFNVAFALAIAAITVAGMQRTVAPTRPLPDGTETDRILAEDALTLPSQRPMVCYNGAGDVVLILDWTSGQFQFDLSAGLTQSGKCRN